MKNLTKIALPLYIVCSSGFINVKQAYAQQWNRDDNQVAQIQEQSREDKVSLLFLLVTPFATIETRPEGGAYIKMPLETDVVAFSDRPHRIAKSIPGGVVSLANYLSQSDIATDPPNITFTGELGSNERHVFTVVEMEQPMIEGSYVLLPVSNAIGEEILPANGEYQNVSIVVDNFWGMLSAIGSATATVGACTVGEVIISSRVKYP